ncbi:MAG: serine/threonine-protein kinase [Planctomycetota bacterium]|jgi:tetratricopeptide (TPR) repeat protein/predicted Ser/Thr protein kinase
MDLSGRLLGEYQLGAELGRGGMGTVYSATTANDGPAGPAGTRVAIKVFHPQLVEDERSLERFRREAEIGKRVRHPHVVRTFAVDDEVVDDQPVHFMVMEFIEGQTLGDLQEELGTVPEHLLFQIADQALDALAEIHGQGVIHRDIKPENIVITPDHRVLLMDLGIARMTEGGHTLTEAGEFVGSLFYAAPEQFIGGTVTSRCDLYAFGMVLYKLATGINPYESMDLSTMLAQKLKHEVAPPQEHSADLDAFWSAIIVTCTRRETAERFADAAELRAILAEGDRSEWWRARTADRAVPSALPALKRLRLQREVSLIGRDKELEHLRAVFRRANKEGRVLLVGGGSGVGKSRLLYEFVESVAASSGPAIGAGRAVGIGGRNYEPFVEAFSDLLEVEGKDRAELEARLTELLPSTPGVIQPLARFLLGDVGESIEKDALLAACADVMRALAAERPLVLIIEDLHLAGPESIDMFAYLARCVEQHPVLLIGVMPEEEVEEGSALHELRTEAASHEFREVMVLDPLTPDAADELVRTIVVHPRTTSALAYPLHLRTNGNPLVMLELLAHLRSSGALAQEGEGFQLVRPLDEVEVPESMQDLVNLRLGKLDEDQREVLEGAAILGFVFEAPLLASVLEVKKIKLLQRLAVLERKYRLLKSSGRNTFRFASPQLHEAVYEAISPALRDEYHAVVADTIRDELEGEAPEPPLAYALVRHLLLSKQALEADPYLEPALEYMAKHVHASVGAPFLEKLAEEFRIARPPSRLAIATELWNYYEMLGQHEDQLRVLTEARVIADELGEAGAKGRVLSCIAATHWFGGKLDLVEEEAKAALELLREADDKVWIAKTVHNLGSLAYRRGNGSEAARLWEEALNMRREIGDRKGEVSSLVGLVAVLPDIGRRDEAVETMKGALAIAQEIGERRFEGALHNNLGTILRRQERNEEAIEPYERAVEIAREVGAQSSEALALGNLGGVYSGLGRIERAKASLLRAIEVNQQIDRPAIELSRRMELAEMLAEFGERSQAQEQLQACLALAERLDDKLNLAAAERRLGALLHDWGKREEGWTRMEHALAIDRQIKNAKGETLTLDSMGTAALNEERFDEAARLLEQSLAETKGELTSDTLVTQCRLASAYEGAGDSEKARSTADTAEDALAKLERLPQRFGPEIHYRLSALTDDDEVKRTHLTVAQNLLSSRANSIANGGYREHFLTQAGQNPTILAEAKRLAAEVDAEAEADAD